VIVDVNCEKLAADFLVMASANAWSPEHVEQIVSAMAPDARYHVFAWQKPFIGRDAIREELLRQAPLFNPDGPCEILKTASAGQTVFVERIDRIVMSGVRVGIHGVLDIDEDGKIASWRDYVDSAEIVAKTRPRGTRQSEKRE
jgi:limonene-1,2-epoxide hydrolase